MNRLNRVSIFPSTRCDRGCRHCLTDSTMKGEDMTVDTVREIIDWIARSRTAKSEKPTVGLTGGGEPLLNRNLPDIIGVLVDANCYREDISMVTSGCLPGTDESDMLKEILDKHGKHLTLNLSFHLFQPSFPQRLEHTLKMALDSPVIKQVNIKMTVFDNSFAAHKVLDKVFDKLDITDVCGTTHEDLLNIGKDMRLQRAIGKNDSRNGIPPLFAALVNTVHFTKEDKIIIVYPQILSKEGRGKNFYHLPETDFCSLFDDYKQRLSITVVPSGNILPAEDSRCHNQKPFYIGNIHEHNFKELLKRRKAARKVLRSLMANSSETPVCQLCRAEMLQQGLLS